MHSKNKPPMTAQERQHVERVKGLPCAVCGAHPPSDAHEIEQGLWFVSVPLCADCHRGSRNGIHGEKWAWRAAKMSEIKALNEALKRLV
jgi:hypothetical protein